MHLERELFALIQAAARVPGPRGAGSNLYTDWGFDSLTFLELLLSIEDRFGISFELTELEECLAVGRLVELVEEKLQGWNDHDQTAAP